MTARATIREADAKRLYRAAFAGGATSACIKIEPDGTLSCTASRGPVKVERGNSFDEAVGG